jgi:hypothetical protein
MKPDKNKMFLDSSVAEPKLFLSAPTPAPRSHKTELLSGSSSGSGAGYLDNNFFDSITITFLHGLMNVEPK